MIGSLLVDPHDSRTLYASAGYNGVFKSTDGGDSWIYLDQVVQSYWDSGLFTLALDPKTPGTLYAGSASIDDGTGALMKSTDGGSTWQRTPLSLTVWGSALVLSVKVDPVDSQVLYAVTYAGGLYRSNDGGTEWTQLASNGPAAIGLAIDSQSPRNLYLAGTGGVFHSSDCGSTWEPILEAGYALAVYVHPHHPGIVYAVTDRGQFQSLDGGAAWRKMSGILPDVIPTAWDPTDPNVVYHGRAEGLFRSLDGGTTWRRLYSGLAMTQVFKLAGGSPDSQVVYAFGGLLSASRALFRSSDGGKRWKEVYSAPDFSFAHSLLVDPREPGTVFLAKAAGGLDKSVDSGATWRTVIANDVKLAAVAISSQNPSIMYAASYVTDGSAGALFTSSDAGETWGQAPVSLPRGTVTALAINAKNERELYVGIDRDLVRSSDPNMNYGLFRSSDAGATWQHVGPTSSYSERVPVRVLAVDPQDFGNIYAGYGIDVYTSTDGGETWSVARTTAPTLFYGSINVLAVDPTNTAIAYAGTRYGLFKSSDRGANWVLEDGFPQTDIRDLVVTSDPNKKYAATAGGGVFSTFASIESVRIPTLSMNSTTYCLGQPWTLRVNGASPGAAIHLLGVSNGQEWQIPEWAKADANGNYEHRGTFEPGSEGSHSVYADVDGASSNDAAFRVSPC
jgi:photosystem II stability/assembly factor-like uncharacterized protein